MASKLNYTILQLHGLWYIAYSSEKQPEPKLISLDKFINRLQAIEYQLSVNNTTVSNDVLDDGAVVLLAAEILQAKMKQEATDGK